MLLMFWPLSAWDRNYAEIIGWLRASFHYQLFVQLAGAFVVREGSGHRGLEQF